MCENCNKKGIGEFYNLPEGQDIEKPNVLLCAECAVMLGYKVI